MSIVEVTSHRSVEPSPPIDSLAELDVALVHDYLNQRGGAERVVLELSDIWPNAPIYTSLYRPESTLPGFKSRDVRTSFLDRLPVGGGFRNLFPLYPAAFNSLGEIKAEVVIASSSGWGHMARVHPDAFHVVYCHTPARWLYRRDYLGDGRGSWRADVVRYSGAGLRAMDRRAARRADLYLANSENVRRLIRNVYGIDAEVLYPPVDTARFTPTPRGERLLVVSRLLPYKHVDLAVRVANQMQMGLDVVGDGPMLDALRELAGPTVTIHGGVGDATVVDLMQGCRAVCVMAEEDFGIVAVEAQAAGKPVVAYGRGGSLETVTEGITGHFFALHEPQSLTNAIERVEAQTWDCDVIAGHACRFSKQQFIARLRALLRQSEMLDVTKSRPW